MSRSDEKVRLTGEETLAKEIAARTGVSMDQARELVLRFGNDFRKIEEAAALYRPPK